MLKIPPPLLYGGILIFATVGSYGISRSVVDLVLLYLIGIMGFFMRKFDFPTAPVIIGMILGPLAEMNFRQAMTISQGSPWIFFEKPLSLFLLALTALALIGPPLWSRIRPRTTQEA
jgi:putative tricarboxylic transport membrane protein